MLTKSDLGAIREIVGEEVEKKLKPIQKNIKIILNHIDIHDLEVDKRIKKLEKNQSLQLEQF